jgi:exopolyphosphatase / guanosine-5'-triphosphate,3'-diphosphate pyrophosphatase
MRIAAIDIGSNAVRLFVAQVHQNEEGILLEKLLHTRVPIRLGGDVFTYGKVSFERATQLALTIKGFAAIIEALYIEEVRACATSALRSAENRDEVLLQVKKVSGIDIKILSGSEEAEMIFGNFSHYQLPKEHHYLFIDVGGGSTELTLIERGAKKASQSFEVGTVRMLLNDQKKLPKAVFDWLSQNINPKMKYQAIATGGNINSAIKILEKKSREFVSLEELNNLKKQLSRCSKEQRMRKYKLREDRADVIVPALNIYTQIADEVGIEELLAPKFGLADGIVLEVLESKGFKDFKLISA